MPLQVLRGMLVALLTSGAIGGARVVAAWLASLVAVLASRDVDWSLAASNGPALNGAAHGIVTCSYDHLLLQFESV